MVSLTQLKASLKKPAVLITVIGLIIVLSVIAATAASVILQSNHITHPEALPTPTPQPTIAPTPTPSPAPVVPTAVSLVANDTGIMYGDKICFTAQLDKPVTGILIVYYNNGTEYGQYFTDALGKAVFTRGPFTGAYDVHVTAVLP